MITPVKTSVQASKTLLGHYAGFVSRLLAFFIDVFLISISAVAITWFLSVTATMLQFRTILGISINALPAFKPFVDTLLSLKIGSLIFLLWVITYHVFFWSFAGQTPGKAFIGLRVVPMRGGKISLTRALIRFCGYCFSALLIGLGFLWIVIDDRRQALHDKLAGTVVIYTWEARPDERFLAAEIKEIHERHTTTASEDHKST